MGALWIQKSGKGVFLCEQIEFFCSLIPAYYYALTGKLWWRLIAPKNDSPCMHCGKQQSRTTMIWGNGVCSIICEQTMWLNYMLWDGSIISFKLTFYSKMWLRGRSFDNRGGKIFYWKKVFVACFCWKNCLMPFLLKNGRFTNETRNIVLSGEKSYGYQWKKMLP